MVDKVGYYNYEERARAKALSREKDEQLLKSGVVSAVSMSLLNGGGHIARAAVRLGKSQKARRILELKDL